MIEKRQMRDFNRNLKTASAPLNPQMDVWTRKRPDIHLVEGVEKGRMRDLNMNEKSYSEYSVVVQPNAEMRAKHLGIIALTAVAVALAITVHWLFLLLVVAGGVGCYLVYLESDMEYETIFLDGTLEIAAIYRKMRRKVKFQCEIKNASGFHLGSKEDAVRLGKITRDFSSHQDGAVCCVLKIGTEKGSHVICFEPGEELTEILKQRYRSMQI